MIKKIAVLALLAFFVVGTTMAMAGGQEKNATQSMYDWFGGWSKTCEKSTTCCCKACGKQCCSTCNTDCGGKCCDKCGKK